MPELRAGQQGQSHPGDGEPRAVTKALAPEGRLVTLAQIHSPHVYVVGPGWDCRPHPEGDAMVSAVPGMVLGIQTADCVPVLLADARAGVVGAAHAGWKGAISGVLDAAIAAMAELGAARRNFRRHRTLHFPAELRSGGQIPRPFPGCGWRQCRFLQSVRPAHHFQFDLPGYVRRRLGMAGVGDVADLTLCTYPPENGFFSFRRTTHCGEPDYGRQISAIVLTG